MSREVDSSRKLWLLNAADGHEILAWTSWKKNKLHSTKRTTGKSLFVEHRSFRFHSLVLYQRCFCQIQWKKKLRKSWNFWTSSWIKTDKSLPTFHGDHSIFDHHFSLFCLREWNLWLEMIDTLIINFWRFRWTSAVSRKVLTLLESALQHFEVLKFLWQLSTTSQDRSSETGPVLTKG